MYNKNIHATNKLNQNEIIEIHSTLTSLADNSATQYYQIFSV